MTPEAADEARGCLGALPESGWPFWWRWVVATNLGWFPGVYLGLRVWELVSVSFPVARAVVAAVIAAALFGATQALVLSRFLGRSGPWWWATLIGWSTGVGIARLLLETTSAGLPALADTVAVAAIAGCIVGVPQAWVLSRRCSGWFWWPAISCVGWAALFPGALSGAGLVWLARSAREDSAP